MNKRQAKKAFKKKYGINPGQAEKLLGEIDINQISEAAQRATEIINDFCKKLPEILNRVVEQFRAAVEQIDEKQLKKYIELAQETNEETKEAVTEIERRQSGDFDNSI